MKKLFALGLVTTFLASCGIGSTPTDFNSLYTANIKAGSKWMEEFNEKWFPTQESTGRFNTAVVLNDSAPFQTMAIASDVEFLGNQNLAQIDLKNIDFKATGKHEEQSSTINAKLDTFSIIGGNAVSFMKLANPVVSVEGLSDAEKAEFEKKMTEALDKFQSANNKWVNYLKHDGVEGAEELDKMMQKMQEFYQNPNYEKYVTKYPIFKAKNTGTQNGTKYTFDVELDTENMTAMINAMLTDVTGSGTLAENADIKAIYEKFKMEDIKVTYDSKDPLYSDTQMVLDISDLEYKLPIHATQEKDRFYAKVVVQDRSDNKELGSFVFESKTSGKNTDFTAKVFADMSGAGKQQTEVFTSTGKIVDTTLQNFDATISAGVAEGTIKYVHKDIFEMKVFAMNNELANIYNKFTGDNFAGKMNIQGQEIATWNAEVAGKKLTALMLKISDMASGVASDKPLLEMNLGKQENSDMIGGTAKVALAGNDFASAKVQLEVVGSEKFGIIIEDIQAIGESFVTEMIPLKKFEFFAQGKTSKTNKKVSLPKETISVTEFQKAIEDFSFLDNIYPTQEYSADDMTDISVDAVPMNVVTAE